MKKQIKNKKQFTLIELIIVIVVIGILAAMALPKFTGVIRNAHVGAMEQDLDIIEKAVMQYVMATDDGSYPFIDINLDEVINEEDLYFKTGTIPQTLTDTLLKTNGDDGSKIYKLDMDKLKPYINNLKYPDTEYVYSPNSDTAIDPIGKPDGDDNIHHIIGGGIVGNSIESGPLYEIYKMVDGFLYRHKIDNTLTYYDYNYTAQNPTGKYGDIQDGDVLMGDNYVYRFRKNGTVECIYNGRYSKEVDLSALTANGDKIDLENDLIQTSMNGLNLVTKSGNIYHFRDTTIYSTTAYKGEVNPIDFKMSSCYYVYFMLHNDKALYLMYGGYDISKSYKIEIPGGITPKDQVLSVGIVTYVIKEDGTIYYANYHNANKLTTIDTSSIVGGIDTTTDTFINGGEKLFVLKQDGSLYRINGDYSGEYQVIKLNTDKLSVKLESNNIKTYVSNDYYNNCPMLIDSKNGKVFTLYENILNEYDMPFDESKDLIRKGNQNGLYLVRSNGEIYKQNSGTLLLLGNLSDFIEFDSKLDAIDFNASENIIVCKNNGDKYFFKYERTKQDSYDYELTMKKIN